jgi:hypothetical protein
MIVQSTPSGLAQRAGKFLVLLGEKVWESGFVGAPSP